MFCKRYERLLVFLLRLAACYLLLALAAVFLPYDWMNALHGALGLGTLPNTPIVQYLTRSVSLLYATVGALYWFVSKDVHRYLPVIRFLGWSKLAFGAVVLVIDPLVGMPLVWTLSEGPVLLVYGVVVLWLADRLDRFESQ